MGGSVNIVFRLTAVAAALFIVTMFAYLVSALSGDSRQADGSQDQVFGVVLLLEAAATIVLGVLAMALDQRQSRRIKSEATSPSRQRTADDVKSTEPSNS